MVLRSVIFLRRPPPSLLSFPAAAALSSSSLLLSPLIHLFSVAAVPSTIPPRLFQLNSPLPRFISDPRPKPDMVTMGMRSEKTETMEMSAEELEKKKKEEKVTLT
ncbi:hypothetical protein Droror1_Dr00020810 [Drosera rotundifolia]